MQRMCLKGTDISGADFSGACGLTDEQSRAALWDSSTRLVLDNTLAENWKEL
jgi:hypothetical protein